MFDWKGLLKKEIELPIEIDGQTKHFVYEQYTIQETLEFHYKDQDRAEWLFEFLNEHGKTENDKLTEAEFQLLPVKKVYKKVLSGLCEGFYEFDGDKKPKYKDEYPIAAYVSFVSKELSIDPLDLMQKYTFQQLNYLTQ